MIYLDNCATTRPRDEVIEVMERSLKEDFANPSSIHSFAMEVENKIENVRNIIGKSLKAKASNIIFTSGGTESSNVFHHGLLTRKNTRKTILTSNQEHPANESLVKFYENKGYKVKVLKSNQDGSVDLEDLKENLDQDLLLVSLIHVNNQLGTINDLDSIVKIIKFYNPEIYIYIDGVQSYGKLDIDLSNLDIDGFSLSGHKIHGPKGVGCLYLKDYKILNPIILGGGQEAGLRSGTENTNSIIGLGEAVRLKFENFQKEEKYIEELRDYLLDKLKDNIEDYTINTNIENSVNNILNISFLNTKGEVLVHFLEEEEIYISTTSACSSRQRVQTNLKKLSYSDEIVNSSVRICLSIDISKEDIDRFVEVLKDSINSIRRVTEKNK